eukprot:NODE_295_length_11479_cov_0.183480.p4 type:complete len:306 gc:universal NODE_295_length_11479_cov_0.183480:9209-8292(-)
MDLSKTLEYCKKHFQLMPNAYQRGIHSYTTVVQFLTSLYTLIHQIQKTEVEIDFTNFITRNAFPHPWIQCSSTSSIYSKLIIIYNSNISLSNDVYLDFLNEIDIHFGKFNRCDSQFDLRFIYCSLASLEIINLIKPDLTVQISNIQSKHGKRALKYIRSCQDIRGAYGNAINDVVMEPHAGYSYCAVASLAILKQEPHDRFKLVRWLVSRQQPDGGFQGRINKSSDTCYSFWVGATLEILNYGNLINKSKMRDFMTSSQSAFGGFGKTNQQFPDPLHSYLGAVGYLIADGQLDVVDPILNTIIKH